ncbi:bifunctional protein-serine/threonine kinase/phosphatase [Pseudohalioglobus sediminis]|uniref:Bifunctional protein-serine/threonine kinase/phosphatase n=1 Tax=Pseudohalioglobus sediminis TaxID=2606449 RepID=A0A5B0WXS2_9GAMM|nr:bifunctional protein-serine/threonine kinase/phosphatase [Pseudohalioglobus sediminis]KAA1191793.1 bifunctional protein-serine/threonine kinase/phosphatase [Pseudohalioglobus sediminis]
MESAHKFSASFAARTDKGSKKQLNEDAVGFLIPEDALLASKGAVAVVADGVSSAEAGREAAQRSVAVVLKDYFQTPELWSVKHAVQKTLAALNRELYDLGRHMPDESRGYICTLSLVVIKSHLAYLFHAGDSRIYRLSADGRFEQLTRDHVASISDEKQYLIRAMGMDTTLNIDCSTVEVQQGDIFYIDSDGIHDFVDDETIKSIVDQHRDNPDEACRLLIEQALEAGSDDNLSACVLRVDNLGVEEKADFSERLTRLPFPPELYPGLKLDGYEVLEELWASERSQLYVVRDETTGKELVMKTPSASYVDDPAYIERFIAEEWIGSRISDPRVVRIITPRNGRKTFLYYLMEKVPGITLQQWIAENPEPRPSAVARIILDIAAGLSAMHEQQIVHQDLKPGNVMILPDGKIKIVDFGAVYAPGLQEIFNPFEREIALGTLDYADPSYRFGINTYVKGDIYSLAVIAYEMFTGGQLPYGNKMERCKTLQEFYELEYTPSFEHRDIIPVWFDQALQKGCCNDPDLRYDTLDAFIYDLQHPNPEFIKAGRTPEGAADTVFFWKALSFFWLSLLIAVLVLWWAN